LPTWNASAPAGFSPLKDRLTSSMKYPPPRSQFAPFSSTVASITSGLRKGTFDGDAMSRSCRAMKETAASSCAETPLTPVVASCHHCSVRRKPCETRLNGNRRQPS
jgi:hypothetical protein